VKGTGVQQFADVCGPASVVVVGGLAMSNGDELIALVPDNARNVARDGASVAVTNNLLHVSGLGPVTFVNDSGTHRLGA